MSELTQEKLDALRVTYLVGRLPCRVCGGQHLPGDADVIALLDAYDEQARESERGRVNQAELRAARADRDALERKLSDAHCLLQSAHAAIDPEEWPEVAAQLCEALEMGKDEGCELPQCKHVAEMEGQLRAIVAAGDALRTQVERRAVVLDGEPGNQLFVRLLLNLVEAWDAATKEAR
jgi:hypothetical protein